MRKIFVIQDSAGWMSDYFFTSRRKAIECQMRMTKEAPDVYDLPLSIREFTAY